MMIAAPKKTTIQLIFLSLVFILAGAATAGAAVMKDVRVTDTSVEFEIEGTFTYTIYNPDPYRAIVEFPGVSSGAFAGKLKEKTPSVSEIQVLEMPHASRVELSLNTPAEIKPQYRGKAFVLNIIPVKTEQKDTPEAARAAASEPDVKSEDAKPAAVETKPEQAVGPASEITAVGFEQEGGTLKFVVTGDGEIKPNIFSLPDRIVMDIPGVVLKAPLPAKTVSPVKAVRSGIYPDKVRLVLDLKGDVTYEAASKGNRLVLSMPVDAVVKAPEPAKPEKKTEPKAAPAKQTAGNGAPGGEPAYKGQRISLDFQNADIGPILMLLGEVSGYNVVLHPSVSGTITLKLKDVPWDQAMDLILETFSLGKSIEGNIMRIAPLSQFAQWQQEKERLKETVARTEDLMQEVIKLNYATAGDISGAISQGKLLSPRGNITTDARMNTLIIQDIPSSIAKMRDLVKIMDVSKPQVMIEAQIVEVSSNYTESLGIRWGGNVNISGAGAESLDFSVNTPVTSAGPGEGTAEAPRRALNLNLGTANAVQLQLSIEALETVNKAKRLANPRVLTMDNEQASIQQGTSIPIQTTSAEGTTVEFVNANLNMQVTPRITPDGYVQLKVMAANDSLGVLTPSGFSIDRKNVDTKALVKDGETLVLGGIFTNNESVTEEGVPLLGRIPVLGWLFKTRTQTGPNPSELLILITPKIVKQAI